MSGHRLFALLYDRMTAGLEHAGLARMREDLIADARGRALEVGAGTGHNLAHYGPGVSSLVLAEPDRFMAARLRRRLAGAPPPVAEVEVVEAPAERLPFPDGAFDAVVSTLVLCTVSDPERALSEIARVLAPEGRLLLIEHVRAEEASGLARWQDRLARPWGFVSAGCHPNRDTARTLASAGFDMSGIEAGHLPGHPPPLVRPIIMGMAEPPAG